MSIPAKTKTRLIEGIKKYRTVVKRVQGSDINESDTVTVLVDILSEVFGYDKYTEITSELAIKKTYCDLAIKLEGDIKLLVEAKSAGIDLKDQHITQAVNYGANSGIEWVVLTNSVAWKVYKIIYGKPVEHDLIFEFNFADLNPKKESDLEMLYLLSKESLAKSKNNDLEQFCMQKELLNKWMVGQIILSEPVLDCIRKTLRKVSPDAKMTNQELTELLSTEIIKRDVIEDEKIKACKKTIAKALKPKATPKSEV